jgi:hypothetical protein
MAKKRPVERANLDPELSAGMVRVFDNLQLLSRVAQGNSADAPPEPLDHRVAAWGRKMLKDFNAGKLPEKSARILVDDMNKLAKRFNDAVEDSQQGLAVQAFKELAVSKAFRTGPRPEADNALKGAWQTLRGRRPRSNELFDNPFPEIAAQTKKALVDDFDTNARLEGGKLFAKFGWEGLRTEAAQRFGGPDREDRIERAKQRIERKAQQEEIKRTKQAARDIRRVDSAIARNERAVNRMIRRDHARAKRINTAMDNQRAREERRATEQAAAAERLATRDAERTAAAQQAFERQARRFDEFGLPVSGDVTDQEIDDPWSPAEPQEAPSQSQPRRAEPRRAEPQRAEPQRAEQNAFDHVQSTSEETPVMQVRAGRQRTSNLSAVLRDPEAHGFDLRSPEGARQWFNQAGWRMAAEAPAEARTSVLESFRNAAATNNWTMREIAQTALANTGRGGEVPESIRKMRGGAEYETALGLSIVEDSIRSYEASGGTLNAAERRLFNTIERRQEFSVSQLSAGLSQVAEPQDAGRRHSAEL